ncbi:MAG TPA: HAD-IIIC family phosphatase [Candidatus Angelobacter sp.]|jgi:FkbH-like protein|nr:HAD-IIIC family phosphatase [Candidatus Angelobacter sp.]
MQAIGALSLAEKRSLLASLLNQNRLPLQLSLTQERLWQLCQLQPHTPLYNFLASLELQGELFPKLLEIAALQVVLRHQVLQTSYGAEKGKPVLSLAPPSQITIALHDLSDFSQQEQEQRMEALEMADVQRSFDLARPPFFRLTLVRLAPVKHRLYLTMHHVVSDFLSLDLFLFELGAFYTAELTGQSGNLSSLASGYQDFARMQWTLEARGVDAPHLEYWRRTLAGANPIEWFSDHVRPAIPTGNAGTEFLLIPSTLMCQIEAFARRQQVTPFMVLLAAFNVLLYSCSGQNDLVVGSPMAGRVRSEYESLIGMFSYPVLMRTNLAGCRDFRSLLQRVRKVVLEATEHGDVPFARIADCVRGSGSQSQSLLRAMFSYVSRLSDLQFEGLACTRRPTNRGVTDLDLFMTIYPDLDEWHGVLEYSADLFERSTIHSFVSAYIIVLQSSVTNPELSLAELAVHLPLKPPARINIAATFTADPIVEVLRFWSHELDVQFTSVIAPYNQLFQQLMDPRSSFFSSDSALNVLLARPEDWIRYAGRDLSPEELLERNMQDFIAAVRGAIASMSCPLKIYLCPSSPNLAPAIASAIGLAEQSIHEAFAGMAAVEVLAAQTLVEIYSATEVHDPQTDRTANIPYKSAFYAALGTQIVRQLRVQVSKPCKVLALDCDNTLWQGLCAEDGAQGVTVSEGHSALQRFVLQQSASGVLICLISKNQPEHVLQVFRENPSMVLKESDITSYRINWEPKSSNLESLAQELQLGLESFVFLDDDSRECAEVSARCPQVLSLRLPHDPAELSRFIQHLWIFDRENVSHEDRRRADFYRDNKRRELARQQSPSLAEFLATLELRVDVHSPTPDLVLRIAQLSQRTNQFNSSGIVFNPLDMQNAIQQGLRVAAVEVSDRFGEYGLAGAVMYRREEGKKLLTVEAFYLSCRVLGRGVEHRVLSELGRIAQTANLEQIHIHYCESSRNQPFRRFLDQLSGQMESPASAPSRFVLSTNDALQAKVFPADNQQDAPPEHVGVQHNRGVAPRSIAALARLPHDLSTAANILGQINFSGSSRRELRLGETFVTPQNGLETTIAAEWSAILRLDKVGRNDNFFELGGNSLLLVQLNGTLISVLGREISIPEMFQFPTVASLANHISRQVSTGHSGETSSRGAKARAALQDRKRQLAGQHSSRISF